MTMYIIMALMAFLGGLVQGITGFGSGIIMMMAFPFFFALPQAAGISGICSLFMTLTLAIKYRKLVQWRILFLPALLFIAVSSAGIFISTSLDQALMKKAFGVFLCVLCIYYLFINKQSDRKLNLAVSVVFIVISGLCDAFFGIGGPLMVIYFLSQIKNQAEYRATIQTFFFCCGFYNATFRVINGIVGTTHLPVIMAGGVAIVIGSLLGAKIADRLNAEILKKATYIMIGVAGIINII
ncbi:MAG: sulfite exporter TauE/SafE family protein [Clostridia bacterium]|nr:sulfite exporter TauE/SafE family protein [Clostridia bacterium]